MDKPLQDKLHELRKEVDAVINSVGVMKVAPNAEQQYIKQVSIQREVSLAFTYLVELTKDHEKNY